MNKQKRMGKKGFVLIMFTIIFAIILMIYFLVMVSDSYKRDGFGESLKLGEYQLKITNKIFQQRLSMNYLLLSGSHSFDLAMRDLYTKGLEDDCENVINPLLLKNSEVCDFQWRRVLSNNYLGYLSNFLNENDMLAGTSFRVLFDLDKNQLIANTFSKSVTTSINNEGCSESSLVFQSFNSAGYKWKMSNEGVIVLDANGDEVKFPTSTCARDVLANYKSLIEAVTRNYGVSEELLIATICTESNNKLPSIKCEQYYQNLYEEDPVKLAKMNRELPGASEYFCCQNNEGFDCDSKNVCSFNKFYKVACSAGLTHVLPDTAYGLGYRGSIDKLQEPETSIELAAKYIKKQKLTTDFDPIRVAAAYNAGALKITDSNSWGLVHYGNHLNRFVGHFNDAVKETGSSYCGTAQLIGSLYFDPSFKVSKETNPLVFKPLLDFVKKVSSYHNTETALEDLEREMQLINNNLSIKANPCDTNIVQGVVMKENEFEKFFENMYFCAVSPDNMCSCEVFDFAGLEESIDFNYTVQDGKTIFTTQKPFSFKFRKNPKDYVFPEIIGGLERVKNLFGLYDVGNINSNTRLYLNKNNNLTFAGEKQARNCIVDKTVLSLCAEFNNSRIGNISFDIEYYEKPQKVVNIDLIKSNNSFLLSWDSPSNKPYWYYIYESNSALVPNSSDLVWDGKAIFDLNPQQNNLYEISNRTVLNLSHKLIKSSIFIQTENTKGDKSKYAFKDNP